METQKQMTAEEALKWFEDHGIPVIPLIPSEFVDGKWVAPNNVGELNKAILDAAARSCRPSEARYVLRTSDTTESADRW